MLKKCSFLSALLILLLACHYTTPTSAKPLLPCSNDAMSAVECKKEFGVQMEKMTITKMTEDMRKLLTKIMNSYSAIKDNMPADGMHVQVITKELSRLHDALTVLNKIATLSDSQEMGEIMRICFMAMQPNFREAQLEESSANREKFDELMEKNGLVAGMIEQSVMTTVSEIVEMWLEMLDDIRDEDAKNYPEYDELKEMCKKMLELTDRTEKMKMFGMILKKLVAFNETPFIKALNEMMCENC